MYIFPPAIPPTSEADLPLAEWRLQVGLELAERKVRRGLFCVVCDEPIVDLDVPARLGFIKAEDRDTEFAIFAVCKTCFRGAATREELKEMVREAIGAVDAPVSRPN
jgi:hypothetical protein